MALGAIAETFETAVTWDRFPDLHGAVKAAVGDTLAAVGGSGGFVSCRFIAAPRTFGNFGMGQP